ncbi:glycosyl hydrolase 115 family protein [Asticcacaulis sp. AC466]|uniref:glycosyl hydrolase 115 family protein n=1 Tax=Asticcacaulis sp. AC466 TaxID=1282362 RepID=UPI0004CE5FED|nr:glycosyl hydrolase 115 family protein [Asticcacaulis sp. AC466]
MTHTRRLFLLSTVAASATAVVPVQGYASPRRAGGDTATGVLGISIVDSAASHGAFPLVVKGTAAALWCDAADFAGVRRAVSDLQRDVDSVTGVTPDLAMALAGKRVVFIGTIGKSQIIDHLIATNKLDAIDLKGKWESFVITVVRNPVPGVDQALVIAGSDKRGTIYGIYELSEQLGVSPWYWWADVPPKTRPAAYVKAGRYASGEPVVKYRGIFINDEAPCMTRWTIEKYGGFNSKMYTHMFELLLRLRANYLWPAMWDSAFNEDDPENPRLADEYGIVMGTSHHEPMVRSQKEWTRKHEKYGNGEWDYATNAEGLKTFWAEGIRRNKAYENVVTIGMRGDGDVAKPSAGGVQADVRQLETIMAAQREILKTQLNVDPDQVPQLWALFTEVQKLYDAGVKVPDDVTLLFTDDNVGNLRRLPTEAERKRKGGSGIYYHLDMHGGPYAYQWINTNPFPKIWEQMTSANEHGANHIWIANVGDLKPLELPIEFFIRLAWNPRAIGRDAINEYTRRWTARDFGDARATEIADIVTLYTKYNGWRKPEMVVPDTYSFAHYQEADRVEKAWDDVTARAEAVYKALPDNQKDAFFQLVLHPTKASGIVTKMNIAAGRSQFYARQGRASTNAAAARARDLFRQDRELSDYYNHVLAGGKWNHMMDQTHLGQYTWQPPRVDMLPPVSEVLIHDTADFGVAIEGDPSAWPDHYGDAILPVFDSLNPGRSYIDVFAQGSLAPEFKISADASWVRLTEDKTPDADRRFWVEVDWSQLPPGESKAVVSIAGDRPVSDAKPANVEVHVRALKASDQILGDAKGRYASLSDPIAIAGSGATKLVPTKDAAWVAIPNYGRGDAAMGIVPITARSVLPPATGPKMLYAVYLPQPGTYHVQLILGPTMDSSPDHGVRIGAAFDDAPIQILDLFEDRQAQTFLGDGWVQAAKDNVRVVTSTHVIETAGKHDFTLTMVDANVIVQKLIIYQDKLPASYFGPPENRLV